MAMIVTLRNAISRGGPAVRRAQERVRSGSRETSDVSRASGPNSHEFGYDFSHTFTGLLQTRSCVRNRLAQRLETVPEVILAVGLTRAFRGQPDELALHRLQVNNLHCPDDPCWRLG